MAAQIGRIGGEFRIGRVLTRAGGIWARHIVPLCLVALVAALPYYTQGFLAGLTGVKQTRPGLAVVFLFTTLVARPLCYAILLSPSSRFCRANGCVSALQ